MGSNPIIPANFVVRSYIGTKQCVMAKANQRIKKKWKKVVQKFGSYKNTLYICTPK